MASITNRLPKHLGRNADQSPIVRHYFRPPERTQPPVTTLSGPRRPPQHLCRPLAGLCQRIDVPAVSARVAEE